ncbi:MAG: glutathione peroxidase [Chitinophagales bacterium]
MAMRIYDFELTELSGKKLDWEAYKGKVLLLVNIASKCGQTPQLAQLEAIYQRYKPQGFEILAFPSNDFKQEPKDADKIEMFCKVNYGVTFKLMAKGHVRGKQAQPLYRFLADKSSILGFKVYPWWNFHKYIVNRNGEIVTFFNPFLYPENDKITACIERELAKSAVDNK